MSIYPGPKQNLSTYNSSNFPSLNDNLTISQANSTYLRLTGGSLSGALNCNNTLFVGGGSNLDLIQRGRYNSFSSVSIVALSKTTITITFPKAYQVGQNPNVYVSNCTFDPNAPPALNFLFPSVRGITNTGFTLEVTNVHPSVNFNDKFEIGWLAVNIF